jgi:O-antigen/teichoic acid export membrane protein
MKGEMSSSLPGIVAAIIVVCVVPLLFGVGALGLSRRTLLELAGAVWTVVAGAFFGLVVLPALRSRRRTPSHAHTPREEVKGKA